MLYYILSLGFYYKYTLLTLKFLYPCMHYIMDNVQHVLLHSMQPFLLEPHSPSHAHTQNNDIFTNCYCDQHFTSSHLNPLIT